MHAFNTSNLTPSQRIERGLAMIGRVPELLCYQPIAFLGTTKADSAVRTAYTDGRNVGISPAFMATLSDQELNFVLMHEFDHIATLDLSLMYDCFKLDPQIANAACDYANNLILADLAAKYPEVLKVPVHKSGPLVGHPFCLLDEKFRGMSKRAIFEALRQQDEDEQQDGEEAGDEQQDEDEYGGFPSLPKPQDSEGEPQDGEGEGEGDGDDDTDDKSDGKNASDQSACKKSNLPSTPTRQHIEANQWDKHDFDRVAEMPADEQQDLVTEVREAVTQGQVLASVAGAKTNRRHESALVTETPWHEVFRDFVKTSMTKGDDLTTWRKYRPSMAGQGIYLPTYYNERMTRLVVARDTSGSISDDAINMFNGHLVSVADEVRPEEIIVLDWGSGVVNDERYTDLEGYDAIMHRTRVVGGGGTSPECIGLYLKQHNIEADAIVVLTDGAFDRYDFDDYGAPTLWCVLPGYWDYFKSTMPRFGQAVKINGI